MASQKETKSSNHQFLQGLYLSTYQIYKANIPTGYQKKNMLNNIKLRSWQVDTCSYTKNRKPYLEVQDTVGNWLYVGL